jgi:RNA polymerase sigma factor for flagellar operon FliA
VRARGRPTPGLRLLVDRDREEASLWRRFAATQESRLREGLFDRYRNYARALARRHVRRMAAAADVGQDLEQFAYRGLLEAIDRFDPALGPPFPAFAAPRIAGSIVDGLAELDESGARLRFQRRVERERLASLAEAEKGKRSATELLGDLVTELALSLMLDAEERQSPGGLAGRPDSAFDNLAWRQTRTLLADRVEALPEPEKTIVRQHYQNGLLFSQIAAILGLSKGRVSQIHKAALARLRKSMRFLR